MVDDICTAQAFSSADVSTSSTFSSAPASGATVPCSRQTPDKPCDVVDLILNSIPATRQHSYSIENGEITEEPVKPSARAISMGGMDPSAPKQSEIQVVAERPGTNAATSIRVMLNVLASHGENHVLLTVQRPGEDNIVRSCAGGSDVSDFKVYRAQFDSLAGQIFQRYFTFTTPPARYLVSVESCGFRDAGTPVGSGSLAVVVYPYDQYSLTLSVPALKSVSYSRSATLQLADGKQTSETERTYLSETKTKTTHEIDADGMVTDSRQTEAYGYSVKHSTSSATLDDGSKLTVSSAEVSKAETDRPSVSLKKNGAAEDVSVTLSKLLQILTDVETALDEIRSLVKDWVPQVGFKFDVSAEFFSGTASMTWGWQEYKDYRAYFGWCAEIDISVFKVALSVSFGYVVGPFTARIVGEIPDAGVDIECSWEFNHPGKMVLPETASAKGEIPAELRGEASFDLGFVRAGISVGFRCGFTAEGGTRLTSSDGCEYYANITWDGLDGFVQQQSIGEGVEENLHHFIDEHKIYEDSLPF
jgi:hypothetical protein